jgi:RNA polymerase sigma-54 factor
VPKSCAVVHINAGLAQRAETRLLLVPKMLQSIRVLQLGTTDLLRLIEHELAENETLECSPAEPADFALDPRGARDESPDVRGDDRDPKLELLAALPAASDRLLDHVREQLLWLDLSPALRQAVLGLAAQLDDRGFLDRAQTELLRQVGAELVDEALEVLRSLEPRGIGARDAIDALLLQLEASDPDFEDIRCLLTSHLDALARHRIPDVARCMSRSVIDIEALLARVRLLDPSPGSRFRDQPAGRIRVDLQVAFDRGGELEVLVNDRDLPSLGINRDYAAMLHSGAVPPEVKSYLRPKLAAAHGLIAAVEQRQRTLARVGAAVVHHQRAFFERGPTAIRPLKMADIADALGMHTSTVSRAVAGKHVQTDRGILTLRSFFDGRRSGKASSPHRPAALEPGAGRGGILERLRELIANERPERPLSDDDLVALLATRDIEVARRTVAKYRRDLGIPSSWRRRRQPANRAVRER